METGYLKTLLAVAGSGSFSRAAQDLSITQSAVSQRIKFLEEQYGQLLLDRSGTTLVPTPAGKIVLARAERIVALERELVEDLQRVGSRQRLAFCSTPSFGAAFLPQVLRTFLGSNDDAADLQFVLDQPEMAVRGVLENRFDLAVIEHAEGEINASRLSTFSLPLDEMIFISSPRLGIAAPATRLETLLSQRLFARKEGYSSRTLLVRNLRSEDHDISDFQHIVVYDDLREIVASVAEGRGIAFVSRSLVEKELMQGMLCEHRVEGFLHYRHRTIALNHDRDIDPLLEGFMNCIFACFK